MLIAEIDECELSENTGKNDFYKWSTEHGDHNQSEKFLDYDNQVSLCVLLKRLNGIQIRQNILGNNIWCGFKFPSK